MRTEQAPDRSTDRMAGNALEASRAPDARRRLSARLSPIPEILWVPGVSAGLILMIGLFGLLFKQPWLFPKFTEAPRGVPRHIRYDKKDMRS